MRAGLAGIRGYESERIDHPSARAGPGDEKLMSVSHGRTASAGTFQPAPLVYPLWNVGMVLFCRLKLCGSYERGIKALAVPRAIGTLQEMPGDTPLFRAQASVLARGLHRDIAQGLDYAW
jgi:hypothetical protein